MSQDGQEQNLPPLKPDDKSTCAHRRKFASDLPKNVREGKKSRQTCRKRNGEKLGNPRSDAIPVASTLELPDHHPPHDLQWVRSPISGSPATSKESSILVGAGA